MSKTILRHTLIEKYFWHFCWLPYLYTFSLYENASFIIVSAEKNDADEAESVVSLTSGSGGYINGRYSANLELLIDKTSSIYLYVTLKALPSWIFLSFTIFEETPTHMSIKIKRLEEGHNLYPLVCRRLVETASLQRRHNVIDEELQHTDHLFMGVALSLSGPCCWKLCELFPLSGIIICHAVGCYIELNNQKFWWRIPERKILISGYPKDI